jgi:uncharacterized protein (TIGR02246 family)
MRNLWHSRVSFFALYFAISIAQGSSSDVEIRSVRDVVAQYMQARNNRDPEAIARLFTQDADQLVSTGEWRRGSANITHGTAISSQKETGQNSITIESVRFIDPDVAIVDGRYETTSVDGTIRKMWTTLIVKRTEGQWRIAAIRNMLPAPSAAAH